MNEQIYTLGSLFDGIGGFPYAASFYGIKTIWASEIIPATISITRRHFPDMEHLGDITKLHGGELTPVDIITFGSPCQSFSIAGGRKGLEGKSGLFWEAIRIIREMREATNERMPQFSVFENVPGILSSNRGSDYKTVLEAFTETEIPFPPSGKWTNAGMVRGGRIDFAWVIHDAQHFGLAQRRKRLFAICDFTGQRAAEILFKPKSLYGHFAEGGKAREGAATDIKGGVGSASGACLTAYAAFMGGQSASASIAYNERISPTLKSGASGTNMVPCICKLIIAQALADGSDGAKGTEATNNSAVTVINDQGGESLTIEKTELSPTLRSEAHGNLPIVSMKKTVGINGDVAGTLDASYYKGVGERCGIEREIVLCAATGQSNAEILNNLSATLTCNCEQPIVCIPETLSPNNDQTSVMPCGKAVKVYCLCADSSNSMRSGNPNSGIYEADTSRTLDRNGGNPVCNQGGLLILCSVSDENPCFHACGFDLQQITSTDNRSQLKEIQPVLCKSGRPHVVINTKSANDKAATFDYTVYCLQGNMIGRRDEHGPMGSGININVCFTISSADRHAVTSLVLPAAKPPYGRRYLPVSAVDCRNLRETAELSGTLQAKSSGSYSLNYVNPIRTGYIVRRLTPTECERLQGYVDGWTEYGHDGKPLSDTARYQALGNSVAIPCVAYVISGIVDELIKADAALKGDSQC